MLIPWLWITQQNQQLLVLGGFAIKPCFFEYRPLPKRSFKELFTYSLIY